MTYSTLNSFTGSSSATFALKSISRKLEPNTILCVRNAKGELIDSYLITHMDVVTFAVEFADYAHTHTLQISGGGRHSAAQIAATAECIALTRRWIADSGSVTPDELYRSVAGRGARRSAVDAAYLAAAISEGHVTLADLHNAAAADAAADTAADVAHDAADVVAARAAHTVSIYAAHAATDAANAATDAADAAHAAARAARAVSASHADYIARIISKSKAAEYVRQGQFILKYLRGV